jgi:hypothetical protein
MHSKRKTKSQEENKVVSATILGGETELELPPELEKLLQDGDHVIICTHFALEGTEGRNTYWHKAGETKRDDGAIGRHFGIACEQCALHDMKTAKFIEYVWDDGGFHHFCEDCKGDTIQ